MKKRVYIGLAILLIPILVISLILAGCTEKTPEVFNLIFSCPFIEVEPPAIFASHFMDLVEEKTEGRVTFERYFSEALAKHTEHIQLLSSGSVDLITCVPTYVGTELVLNQLPDYPMYCSLEESIAAANKLMMEIPETKAILDAEQERLNIKILYWQTSGPMDLLCRDEVTSLTELNGKKVNMWAPADVDIWGEFGMFAVPVYVADFYESLSRGVIDSAYFPPSGSLAMKLFETAKSNLGLRQGGADVPIIFNLDTWNSFPSDIQDLIMEAALETSQWSIGFSAAATEQSYQVFRDSGMYVGDAPEEDTVKLFEAIMKYTVEEQWVNQCEAAGVGEEAQVLLQYWRDMAYGR
ncbi:MAG: TRAP transporter substrate-binding protein DctP [Chloroflexota bacterium]